MQYVTLANLNIFFALFVGCSSTVFPCRAEDKDLPSTAEILLAVNGEKADRLESVANKHFVARASLGKELISVLSSEKSSSLQKFAAAYFLGEFRVNEAIPVLLSNISLRYEGADIHRESIIPDCPAVDALIKIGFPSLVQVLNFCFKSTAENDRDRCIVVLCVVVGRNRAIAKALLGDAAKKAGAEAQLPALNDLVIKYTEPYGRDDAAPVGR
ncbi:MAG: hypothetical protein NTW87_30750 [Planctomycetota bacterium]|nr:hypothetical protein [Planctomycetota bacterium]